MFVEFEFPKTISYKAMGGPAFNTTVNAGFSGFEQRNQNWQVARGQWTVSLETPVPGGAAAPTLVSTQQYIDMLTSFFLNVGGKANAFRLKDHKDFTNGTTQQPIGAGDGITGTFLLVKNYASGYLNYQRFISKPITSLVLDYLGNALLDTVAIKVNTTLQTATPGYRGGSTAKYTLDETTGSVCFGSNTVMNITAIETLGAGGQFKVYYALTSGPAPIKNQQVIIHQATLTYSDTLYVTSVGVGSDSSPNAWFTIQKTGTQSYATTTGTAYTSWSDLAITGVTAIGGGQATYSYTLTSGLAPQTGQRVFVRGMAHSGNNITGNGQYITSTGAGTFTCPNGTASIQTESGQGTTDWVPASGAGVIYATYQYHQPVRFDVDNLAIQLEESNVEGGQPIVTWNSITLQEVRILPGQSQG